MAEVAVRSRRDARRNEHAQVRGDFDVDALLPRSPSATRCVVTTLPPITDGACALVIARADVARRLCEHPVWIRGFAHCAELHYPGMRDLCVSESAQRAAEAAGVRRGSGRGGRDPGRIHPRGAVARRSPRAQHPMWWSTRPAARWRRTRSWRPVWSGSRRRPARSAIMGARRTLGHSTSGPCLQQNLVCILEGD